MKKPTWQIRFWTLFEKRGPDECWPWLGPINRLGYGTIGRGKAAQAFREKHEALQAEKRAKK